MMLTWMEQVIRDYLWETKNLTPYTSSRTISEVMGHVNLARAATGQTMYGTPAPVRKALDHLVQYKLVKVSGKRPMNFRYDGDATTPPRGYQPMSTYAGTPVTQKTPAGVSMSAAPPKTTWTPSGRRAELTAKLQNVSEQKLAANLNPPATKITPKVQRSVKVTYSDKGHVKTRDYFIRNLAGMPDIDFYRSLRESHDWLLLYGPPGTGKTISLYAAFAASNPDDVVLVTGDENTTFDDLFGTWTGRGDGQWEWVDGPATYALKNGKVLFIDDITLISPLVLASLYSVMDGRDEVIIKTHVTDTDPDGNPWKDGHKHQEVVRMHDDFYLVGAYNPATPGAILAPALSSRFKIQVEVTSDYDLARNAGVPVEIVKVASNLDTARQEKKVGWAPQLREMFDAAELVKKFTKIMPGGKAAALEMALANLAGIPDDDGDRQYVLAKIREVHGGGVSEHLKVGKQM